MDYRFSDFTITRRADFGAVEIVESDMLVETVEDWSRVRSPGRARRRLAQGHKQNIRTVTRPKRDALMVDGKLYVHSAIAAEIRRQVNAQFDRLAERTIMGIDGHAFRSF